MLAAVVLVAGACSTSDDEGRAADASPATTNPTATTAPVPAASTRQPTVDPATLEGPVTVGKPSFPADPRPVDLVAVRYEESEWFASGTASAFAAEGEIGQDGEWSVTPTTTASYKTRFVVRKPANPADFNGTVVVEWLNVSAVEANPEWTYTNRAIVDRGAAWVGVSVQSFGVVGGTALLQLDDAQQSAASNGGIKASNPERYGSLEHPGDTYAFDIYSQIGAALRSDGAKVFGTAPKWVLAAGESQSAGFLTGYINAFQKTTDVYDGFFVHSRGAGAAQPDGSRAVSDSSTPFHMRTDLDVPILVFQTETDVGPLLRFATARQPDTDLLRIWEVAGTAHADSYLVGGNFPLCPAGINQGPQHWVATAAMDALIGWVTEGTPPSKSDPIQTESENATTVVRDEHGLALGGVRTPAVEAPTMRLTGAAAPDAPIICALFGGSSPFTPAELKALYPTQDAYLAKFDAALDAAIEAGFVRGADRGAYTAEGHAFTVPTA